MKRFLIVSLVTASVAISSLTVFAASADTSTTPNTIDSVISKVTGFSSDEVAAARADGIGYGKLIPASILAKKMNISLQEAVALKEDGKTYAQVAQENGITLDEYKQELLNERNELIDEKVNSGYISAEQGEAIKERITENISNCDGTGSGQNRGNGGCNMGGSRGFGRGNKMGGGRGRCN